MDTKNSAGKFYELKLEVITDNIVSVSVFTVFLDQNMIIDFYIEMIEHCGDQYILYIDGVPVKWSLECEK